MKRIIAIAMALVLCCGLFVTAAFAEEHDAPGAASSETEAAGAASTEEEAGGEAETAPFSPAGPDAEQQTDPETGEVIGSAAIEPDAVGTVSFANVERRMRENNLNILALQESIDFIDSIDYDKWYNDLRDQLNGIASQQWYLIQGGMSDSYAYAQLQQGYDAARAQFDAIKDGDLQEDNEGAKRQLKNLQDQIVMSGEMMYASLAALETQEAALQRQLASLNRTVEEMELRYQLGQVSALQLTQAKNGRSQLVSGLETLQMNIYTLKLQLEMLLGAGQTGEISLGAVPEVTEEQLDAMDLDKDLASAKEKSYELYDAEQTLKDEEEAYKDAGKDYGYNENKMLFRQAKHNWQAAQYTYNNTVQNYELKFRTLYAQVQDYRQILDAARVSLECEKASYQAAELKYQQGTISKNALLDAGDSLKEAEEKVKTAANDLFSSYNTYCWAVQHGILN